MSASDKDVGKATRLAHAGRRSEWTGRVVNTPVWRASTHLYASEADRKAAGGAQKDGEFFYGRRGAPTQWSLAEALTEIEPGAHGTVLYPSGVAAIAGCMLAVLRPGDQARKTHPQCVGLYLVDKAGCPKYYQWPNRYSATCGQWFA